MCIWKLNQKDDTANTCIRPPGTLFSCIHLHLHPFFLNLFFLCLLFSFSGPFCFEPQAVNIEIIIGGLFANCVFLCIPQALQSNRLQITLNICWRKAFEYFSASDELQLNLPPDEQKGKKAGGWWRMKLKGIKVVIKGKRKRMHRTLFELLMSIYFIYLCFSPCSSVPLSMGTYSRVSLSCDHILIPNSAECNPCLDLPGDNWISNCCTAADSFLLSCLVSKWAIYRSFSFIILVVLVCGSVMVDWATQIHIVSCLLGLP